MFEPLALLNALITLGLIIGGLVAYRHGFAQTANEVQERVINALQTEIGTLHDRITGLEEENARLNRVLSTLCVALKQRGISVSVDGDAANILEREANTSTGTAGGQGADVAAAPSKARRARKRASAVEGAA
jgi:hypothetical protein